jgi:hypothetical protein
MTAPWRIVPSVHRDVGRRPAELLEQLGRGQAVGLTLNEERGLGSNCRDRLSRFRAEICNRLQANDLRGARHKLHKMLGNRACRLAALIAVERRRRAPRRQIAELAQDLHRVDPFRRARPHTLEYQPKREEGQYRPIYKFHPWEKAAQLLISEGVKPFARAHPRNALDESQVLYDGGLPTACERIRSALLKAPADAWFLQVDVKTFYAAIAVQQLARITGLPQEVVHNHLSCAHLRPRQTRVADASSLLVADDVERLATLIQADERVAGGTVRGGSPMGSAASSIAAEMVMASILRAVGTLRDVLLLIVYSDNIGVLVPSREAALAVREALLEALHRHPAGPFRPSKTCITSVRAGFNYLGYQWRKGNGRVTGGPRPGKLSRWLIQHGHLIIDRDQAGDPIGLLDLRTHVRRFCESHPAWDGRHRFQHHHEMELISQAVSCCRRMGFNLDRVFLPHEMPLIEEARQHCERRETRRRRRWEAGAGGRLCELG